MRKNKILSKVILFLAFIAVFYIGYLSNQRDGLTIKSRVKTTEALPKNKSDDENKEESPKEKHEIKEDENYTDLEQVAQYVHIYKKLPSNYITKAKAKEIGWSIKDKDMYVIGGDKFGNREGKLPKKDGRKYYEADVPSGYKEDRGAERLIFSNDGLIYYTNDHYKTFKKLY